MKTFLAQIDWVRNTFFFFAYFFIIAGTFIGYVMPALDEFRIKNASYRRELFVLSQIEAQRDAEKAQVENFQSENNRMLSNFENRLSQEEILAGLQEIFTSSSVEADGAAVRDGKFIRQNYIISGTIDNMEALKGALALPRVLNSVVKFNFPITIEQQKDDELSFSFRIEAYSVK